MNGSAQENSEDATPDTSVYWRQQHQLVQVSRDSSAPHSYARSVALASKTGNTDKPTNVTDLAIQLVRHEKLASTQQQSGNRTPARAGGNSFPNPQEKKDQMEEARQKHINEVINKQFWTAIDMSGQGLLNVSPKICNYGFLQKLYLNHNNLTTVPLAITKMSQLKVLDLSHNSIKQLPEEIGRMLSLRYLFLFDNAIENLPAELGALFQLEMLGIEGNPLNEATRTIFGKAGTKGLIVELRDSAPPGPPPRAREWIHLDDMGAKSDIDNESPVSKAQSGFTVLSYNTLCDRYTTPQLYGYTASWALDWSYRSELLISEVLSYDTDILCLQEVNKETLDNLWIPALEPKGYKVMFYPKTRARTMSSPEESRVVDGCVICYKTSKMELINYHSVEYNSSALAKSDLKKSVDVFNRVMTRDNVALIAAFQMTETKQFFVVANTHLHWDPAFCDVKLVQSAILLEQLEQVLGKYTSNDPSLPGHKLPKVRDIKQIPTVICGDFNSTSKSGVYQLFSQGSVPATHEDLKGYSYGNFTEQGIQQKLAFKSAYADDLELPFTNFTPNFTESIDYIWYSRQGLKVKDLVGQVDPEYASHYVGFPNAHHPSDHVPIAAHLEFTK